MNKSLLALSLVLAGIAVPSLASAELAYNAGVVTDYRYRGISQSRLKPALQGGVDYSKPNGLYVGAWASTIKWIEDAGTLSGVNAGNAKVEIDLYGGVKGEISKGLAYDIGGLYYWYPGNKYAKVPGGVSADTFEIYGALSYGVFTAKYSHSLTHTFGTNNSKGSGYLDLSATFDIGNGLTLTPHLGRQEIRHYGHLAYNDYALTLAKDLGNGVSLSAALVGTDADKRAYVTPAGKFTGKNALVVGAKYSF